MTSNPCPAPPPRYPYLARRNGIEGRVVLTIEVLPAGVSGAVRVKSSSGHPMLDEAALSAVKNWRFRPATQAGNPVSSSIEVPIRFRLDGRASAESGHDGVRG